MFEDRLERAAKAVPEWYVDLLARFVPGSVFLLVYLWPYLSAQIPFVAGLGLILFAYFIGLFAEVLSRIFLSPLLRRVFFILRPGLYRQTREMLAQFEGLSESQQYLLKKLMAESALFRALVILCIPLFIYRAPFPFSINYYATVSIAAVLFLVCHIDSQMHLRRRVEVFLATSRSEPSLPGETEVQQGPNPSQRR